MPALKLLASLLLPLELPPLLLPFELPLLLLFELPLLLAPDEPLLDEAL